MRTRLDAWPSREEEIIGDLLERAKPLTDGASPAPPRAKVSIHAALQTPREVNDVEQLEMLVAEFRSHLELAMRANGGITIVS